MRIQLKLSPNRNTLFQKSNLEHFYYIHLCENKDSIENAREMLSAAAIKADAEGLPIDFHS